MRINFLPLVVLVCVVHPLLLADLDVGIPPGTPLEWRNELPFHQPEGHRGPIYTHTPAQKPAEKEDEEKDVPRGRTIVVRREVEIPKPPALERFGAFNPMGAARILTMDITGHWKWSSWGKLDGIPEELNYPPETRVDLYWLTLTPFLRVMLHPTKVSKAEIMQYLITIGPPVLDTLEHTRGGLGPVRQLAEYLTRNIPPLPPQPPDYRPLVRDVKDPELAMLIRWSSRELVSDHPYAYNPLYARRTRSLGGEAVPVLLALTKSRHHLLRENAAGLLAGFDTYDEEVLEELRRLFRSKDPVARNRALEGLVGWRDKETEQLLTRALTSSDRPFSVYAVQALGRMQSSTARVSVRKLLRARRKDHGQTWLAVASALSRLQDPDGKSRQLLLALKRRVASMGEALDPLPAAQRADAPDMPGDRARLLLETITLAMARLGDEKARDWLVSRLEDPDVGGGADAGGRFRRQVADRVLGRIEPFNQLLAIEALASLGDDGRKHLKKIIEDSFDSLLRGYALEYLVRLGQDNKFVYEVAESDSYPSVVRVQAMKGLARNETTRESALDVARAMVGGYIGAEVRVKKKVKEKVKEKEGEKEGEKKGKKKGGRLAARAKSGDVPSYECLSAIKLLGKHDPLPVATLRAVLQEAKQNGDYERLVQEKAGKAAPGRRGPGRVNTMTLRAFPALYETAVVELGRLADVASLETLRTILEEPDGPGRPEAALALGNLKVREACDVLIDHLEDIKPWVRYSAYRALKKISEESHFADWLFGKAGEREQALEAWREWRRTKGEKLPTAAEARKQEAAAKKAAKA